MITLKNNDQIEIMYRAGQVVARTLSMVRETIQAGMSTGELDRIIEEFIRSQGAIPAFKGYQGYPASSTASPANG